MENSLKNPVVCFFDSGIGGLNLLYGCVKALPRVDFIYFADNYRVPYGSLPYETMLGYVLESFDKMQKLNPAAAVVACNTVTAGCIDVLRSRYPFKIIGIQPAVKPAASSGGKCVVLATPATAQSKSLHRLIEQFGNGEAEVIPCPNLAAYIEDNIFNLDEKKIKLLLPDVRADSVVLGCTHYIFAETVIAQHYNCPVFDGIEGTVNHLAEILGKNDHILPRAQKISFSGGDERKNRNVFNGLLQADGQLFPNKWSSKTKKL